MLQLGFQELAIIAVVALIVVGPKDLPVMFQKLGQMVGKARGMARDFQRAMNDAADSAGVGDLKDSLDEASKMADVKQQFKDYANNMGNDLELDDDPVKSANAAAEKAGQEFAKIKAERAAEAQAAKEATEKAAATKKPATKKTPAKKPSAKKTPAKKSAPKKSVAKKPKAKAASKKT